MKAIVVAKTNIRTSILDPILKSFLKYDRFSDFGSDLDSLKTQVKLMLKCAIQNRLL